MVKHPLFYPVLQLWGFCRFEVGLSTFCSEKAKKLLRNMPKSCSKVAQKLLKNFVKLLEYVKMLSRCCPGNSLILAQTDVLELGFLCSRLALYCPLFTITFRFRPIEAFSGTPSEAPLLTAWVLLERCLILNKLYFKRVTPITMKYSP